MLGTFRHTVAAMPAALLEVQHLRPEALAFGIVAPPASKRTSFEEDGSPDARPIMRGKAHDVEDYGSQFAGALGVGVV
jgi:hypothetical protein